MSFEKSIENARIAFKKEHFDKALGFYNEAINTTPNDADIISEKGVTLFHLKRLPESLECMNLAQKKEPNNPYRYSSRAFIKDALGKTDEAITDYEKCIQLDPDDAIAYNNLGLLQEKLGRLTKAKNNFNKADELAEILEQNNITSTDVKSEPEFVNLQKEINEELKETKSKGKIGIIKDVFTDKLMRKEFLTFIKSGFKATK